MKLNYITLDQLMSSVESDFYKFADNGMIDRGNVIKVVRKVNEDIGLKIYRDADAMVEISNFKGDLPADFSHLQMAVAVTVEHAYMPPSVFGTHTEERPVRTFGDGGVCLKEFSGFYTVVEKWKDKVVTYNKFTPLKLCKSAMKFATENCINFGWNKAPYDIDIQGDEIITGFREGRIYISYLTDMVDEEGNLLLLDHPLTNEYYEYAVKKHLLENYFMNNDADVQQRLGYIKGELRDAKIRAIDFVSTPEYQEIVNTYENSRRRFYNKYHKIIE